jgi:hypothetical protein
MLPVEHSNNLSISVSADDHYDFVNSQYDFKCQSLAKSSLVSADLVAMKSEYTASIIKALANKPYQAFTVWFKQYENWVQIMSQFPALTPPPIGMINEVNSLIMPNAQDMPIFELSPS